MYCDEDDYNDPGDGCVDDFERNYDGND